MTRDDIIRMAREVWGDDSGKPWSESALLHFERFAAIVSAEKDKKIQELENMLLELQERME